MAHVVNTSRRRVCTKRHGRRKLFGILLGKDAMRLHSCPVIQIITYTCTSEILRSERVLKVRAQPLAVCAR